MRIARGKIVEIAASKEISTIKERDKNICVHLGLADNPFDYSREPHESHRCYLYMQRERIDLDHQADFCLSELHAKCPWLSISSPAPMTSERAGAILLTVLIFLPINAQKLLRGLYFLISTQLLPFLSEQAFPYLRYTAGQLISQLASAIMRIRGFTAGSMVPALSSAFAKSVAISASGLRCLVLLMGWALSRRPRRLGKLTQKSIVYEAAEDRAAKLARLGKEAAIRGDKKSAYNYFCLTLELAPESEGILLWKAATTEDKQEAAACLRRALDLNPSSGRAKAGLAALGEMPVATAKAEAAIVMEAGQVKESDMDLALPIAELLQQGVAALDVGDEDRAHRIFVMASETYPDSQEGWFWRARTAMDLDELITSLERLLDINPGNGKVQADLDWAIQRRRRELSRVQAPATAVQSGESGPVVREAFGHRLMIHVAGIASFVLGLLWVAATIAPLLESSLSLGQRPEINALPILTFPHYALSSLGFYELIDFIPDFNLYALVPLGIGVAFMLVAEGLLSRSRASVFWLVLVIVGAMVSMYLYSSTTEALQIVLMLGGLALISSLLGWPALGSLSATDKERS